MSGFNFRFQGIVSVRNISRQVFDMTTEITEYAKLAEDYYGRTVDCSAHIESCVGKIHDLGSRLSSLNTDIAASARRSLGNVRLSVDSLLSAPSSGRPICSVQAASLPVDFIHASRSAASVEAARPVDFVEAVILEVEQLKNEQNRLFQEQMQLGQRWDQLLAFLRTRDRPTEQRDQAEKSPHQNMDSGDDTEPLSDEVLLLSVSDSVNTDAPDTGSHRPLASEPNNGSPVVMPPSAADGQCSTSFMVDVPESGAVAAAVSDSSSTHQVSKRRNASAVAARRCAAGHTEPTAMRPRQNSSRSTGRKSSVTRSRGRANSCQGTAATSRAVPSAVAPATSSPSSDVELTAAEFRSPPRPPSRGRGQARWRSNVRAVSADAAAQSSLPSDTTSSGESTVKRTHQNRRGKSVRQAGARIAAVAHQQHDDSDVVGAGDILQSAVPHDPAEKTRRNRRSKSAAPNAVVGGSNASPALQPNVVGSDATLQSAVLRDPAEKTRRNGRSKSAAPNAVVGGSRYRRSKSTVAAAQTSVGEGDATSANQHDVTSVVASDAARQSAVVSDPSQGNRESEAVGKGRRRRTKSAAAAAVTEKTRAGAVDGEVILRGGGGGRPRRQTAGGSGSVVPSRRRSCTGPPNAAHVQADSSATRSNVNGAVPPTASATSPDLSRSVTTYLSGTRTDIFGQHLPQPTASPARDACSDSLMGTQTVDTRPTARPAASASNSASTATTRWALLFFRPFLQVGWAAGRASGL